MCNELIRTSLSDFSYLRGHPQIENSILKFDLTSRYWIPPPPPPLTYTLMYIFDENKDSYTFSRISIAVVNSHQNSILYTDRTSWNCNNTRLVHVACMISSAIATDCWRPRQENFLPSTAFLFNEDSESVENTFNPARLGKSWNEFNLLQARKIDFWNKMRTAIEVIDIWF